MERTREEVRQPKMARRMREDDQVRQFKGRDLGLAVVVVFFV